MWQCPTCGREFEKQNQSHTCPDKPGSIDEYIEMQHESVQQKLREVREAIKNAIPDAEERISWSMPTFWKRYNIIHFAASKNHMGIYPGPVAIEHFADRLTEYKTSKGTIQFPYSKPFPLELIADIAKWCYANRNNRE